MNKKMKSTFEREMQNSKFQKAFAKSYKKLTAELKFVGLGLCLKKAKK